MVFPPLGPPTGPVLVAVAPPKRAVQKTAKSLLLLGDDRSVSLYGIKAFLRGAYGALLRVHDPQA